MAKICILADADSIHTRKWVEYFSDFDNEIYVISMRNTKFKYKNNVKVIVIEPPYHNKISYLFIINEIRKTINNIRPDILHSHYATSYGLYGRMSGYHPFVVSVWGSDVYEFPRANAINNKLLKFILNGADIICSTSHDMANETKKYCNNKEIIITPFGVDINKFSLKKSVLSNEHITIGLSKNLKKIYGIEYLIKAFSSLVSEVNKEIRLMIVGDGPERKSLETLCGELGISSNVDFLGNVDNNDIPYYINEMDIVCIPSLSESFGVAAVEASACGRPVVATNVGGLKEIVIDGYNGYTVNPKNAEALKEKLKILINDEEKIIEFSKNARNIVETNYNWQDNAETMKRLYDKLIAGKGTGS